MVSAPEWRPRPVAECWPGGEPKAASGWRRELVGKNKLPRSLSLKRRAEIDSLFEKGQRFPTDFFTLIWQPAEQFKYGVFVSRQLGPASRRNRIKRRFREAIRHSREVLEKSGRVAILPRAVGQEPKLERLIEDVSRVFRQVSRNG